MDIKSSGIINLFQNMGDTPVATAEQEIQISLEELDNIATDEQKLAMWQQIVDKINEVRHN